MKKQYSTVQHSKYSAGCKDKVPTSALAGEPRAHKGANRAYHLIYSSLSGQGMTATKGTCRANSVAQC